MTVQQLRDLLESLPAEAHVCGATLTSTFYPTGTKVEIEYVTVDRHGVVVLTLNKSADIYELGSNKRVRAKAKPDATDDAPDAPDADTSPLPPSTGITALDEQLATEREGDAS